MGCTLFSCFMLDRTAVMGGYYENASGIFMNLDACVPKES
jgi:hypothetical protein